MRATDVVAQKSESCKMILRRCRLTLPARIRNLKLRDGREKLFVLIV